MDNTKRIVEINGVKLEVDMSTARVIDQYKIGDNVKVLIKNYSDYRSYPGVIVGFDPFVNLPTIVIAYLDAQAFDAQIKFVHLNAQTKDCEVCPMLEKELPFDKHRVMEMFDRQITDAETKLRDLKNKKQYFLDEFGSYFKNVEAVEAPSGELIQA